MLRVPAETEEQEWGERGDVRNRMGGVGGLEEQGLGQGGGGRNRTGVSVGRD